MKDTKWYALYCPHNSAGAIAFPDHTGGYYWTIQIPVSEKEFWTNLKKARGSVIYRQHRG